MRLRAVVHAGQVLFDEHGYSGDSVIHATRLLDAGVGRAILTGMPDVDLVVLVSEDVYQSVVRHAYQDLRPNGYQPVWAQYKETGTRAWVRVPGRAVLPDLSRLSGVLIVPAGGSTVEVEYYVKLRTMHAAPAVLDVLSDEAERPLLGRAQECGLLARFAASVPQGQRGLLLVEGAAGMGKTRLLAELWRRAEEAGVRTVAVACPEPEVRVALDPWRKVLATLWPEVLQRLVEWSDIR